MKDMHTTLAATLLIGPAMLDADTGPATVDLSGFKAAEIIFAVGEGGIEFDADNRIEFVAYHSEDGETFDPLGPIDVVNGANIEGGVVKVLDEAHEAPVAYRIGYKGNRRFLRLSANFVGAHAAGTPVTGMVLTGAPRTAPTILQT